MKIRKVFLNLSLALFLLLQPSLAMAESLKPKIQIAILLDSSNSMDGLIDQTRSQLWKIVNALTKVTKNGKVPILEISLYHYGNDSLPSSEGFNLLLSEFTTELDLVSEKLFLIQTNGGEEYAGWVMQSALRRLNWSNTKDDFKVIFIAGNEPFDQGKVDWQEAVMLAKEKDVLVDTIYCGDAESLDRQLWVEGANLGNGINFNINQNQKIVQVTTPYDQEIVEWNKKLNNTYIPYGEEGIRGQQRQLAEDDNSQQQLAARGIAKSSSYYRNSSWDLIDGLTDNVIKLDNLQAESLPANMRRMSQEQRQEYIAKMRAERARIQKIIADLSNKREQYIQQHGAYLETKDTLDYVMIQALRQQLAAKGFILQ